MLPTQHNSIDRNFKLSTAKNFYRHKRVNSNIEKYEGGDKYLVNKYAWKFKLKEESGLNKRVENIVNKISNET
jgi:hypothetical protein